MHKESIAILLDLTSFMLFSLILLIIFENSCKLELQKQPKGVFWVSDKEFIAMIWSHPELWSAFKEYMKNQSSNIPRKTASDKT